MRCLKLVMAPLVCLSLLTCAVVTAQQPQRLAASSDDHTANDNDTKNTAAVPQSSAGNAAETATKLRQALPVLPSLVRGDGLFNLFGQRALQTAFVSGSNAKDPVTDTFVFPGVLPVEGAEPVHIPTDQFTPTLNKFYVSLPDSDRISPAGWHFSAGAPQIGVRRVDQTFGGMRSASPSFDFSGPLAGGKAVLFQSFSFRFARSTAENIDGGSNDTIYHGYDWNTHFDIRAIKHHTITARLALFSQGMDFANMTGLVFPEAAPDFLMQGGQVSVADSFAGAHGEILDSSFSYKKLHLRILPHGDGPMFFIEQGELEGNYFDTVHRASTRFEWKEAASLRERHAAGRHQISFGGGYSRSAFDSSHYGGQIILRGKDSDELTSITSFRGTPFEAIDVNEAGAWVEDKWSPSRQLSLTLGLKYDWTTLSRENEWAPRAGFALLPWKNGRTVIRGGIGIFYDIQPMNAGTFIESRQRVIQFFNESIPLAEKVLDNLATKPHLNTSHVFGWNLEVDQQVGKMLILRFKGEERNGRNLMLIKPDQPSTHVTALVLSDTGMSRSREFEATAVFRPASRATANFSYIRSSSVTDVNIFASNVGTFEKLFFSSNRFARSRTEAPDRFLAWGELRAPGEIVFTPALDVHTGFPFAFVDADNKVPNEIDFGRLPRTVSLDMGVHREFAVSAFDHPARFKVGLRVYNLTGRFNPRDAQLDEDPLQNKPILKRFFNSVGRSYRASVMFEF